MFKFVIPVSLYKDKKYNNLRRSELILISNIFHSYLNMTNTILPIIELTNIIISIELSCYNKTLFDSSEQLILPSWDSEQFEFLYRSNISRITKNLDFESEVHDDYLIKKIINKELDPNNISNLSTIELCPIKSKNIIDKLNERSNQKIILKTSTMYKCRNCGKKSVTITEFQARSLDESSSLSLCCTFCSYRWVA